MSLALLFFQLPALSGTLTQTVAPITATATGTARVAGVLAQAIAPITAGATATVLVQASLNSAIAPIALAGTILANAGGIELAALTLIYRNKGHPRESDYQIVVAREALHRVPMEGTAALRLIYENRGHRREADYHINVARDALKLLAA